MIARGGSGGGAIGPGRTVRRTEKAKKVRLSRLSTYSTTWRLCDHATSKTLSMQSQERTPENSLYTDNSRQAHDDLAYVIGAGV